MARRPRLKTLKKDAGTIRILGRDIHKTTLFFIAQIIAFWLLILGMFLFVWIWYVQNVRN